MSADRPLFERDKMVWRLPNGDTIDDSLSFQRSMLTKIDGTANQAITLACVFSIGLAVITAAMICIAAAINLAIAMITLNIFERSRGMISAMSPKRRYK